MVEGTFAARGDLRSVWQSRCQCKTGPLRRIKLFLACVARQVSRTCTRWDVTREQRPEVPLEGPTCSRIHDTVRLSASGLAKVLGDLESRVLRTVWALGRPGTARTIHERIERQHAISSLTTITVLNKLVRKGILSRQKQDDVFHYRARLNESEFMAHASRRVVEGILSFGSDAVAASFVDVLAETDPEKLAELGRLIRRKLRESDSM